MKYYLFLSTFFISLSMMSQVLPYKSKYGEGYIFDSSFQVFKSINDENRRCTPSETEVNLAELILKQQLKSLNKNKVNQFNNCPVINKRLHKYFRQYVGFINNSGEKVIWINFFWNKNLIKQAKENIIEVNDGCSYYWNIEVNIDKGMASHLKVNGAG